ncbi:DUF6766 family protein, partial [Saccharopolyspora endophytica]
RSSSSSCDAVVSPSVTMIPFQPKADASSLSDHRPTHKDQDTPAQHGQTFQWASFLYQFFSATFENWQSEWLQLIFQAILLMGAKHWLFQAEAKDLERIEDKLDDVLSQRRTFE